MIVYCTLAEWKTAGPLLVRIGAERVVCTDHSPDQPIPDWVVQFLPAADPHDEPAARIDAAMYAWASSYPMGVPDAPVTVGDLHTFLGAVPPERVIDVLVEIDEYKNAISVPLTSARSCPGALVLVGKYFAPATAPVVRERSGG